jgi:hypothetical protein
MIIPILSFDLHRELALRHAPALHKPSHHIARIRHILKNARQRDYTSTLYTMKLRE